MIVPFVPRALIKHQDTSKSLHQQRRRASTLAHARENVLRVQRVPAHHAPLRLDVDLDLAHALDALSDPAHRRRAPFAREVDRERDLRARHARDRSRATRRDVRCDSSAHRPAAPHARARANAVARRRSVAREGSRRARELARAGEAQNLNARRERDAPVTRHLGFRRRGDGGDARARERARMRKICEYFISRAIARLVRDGGGEGERGRARVDASAGEARLEDVELDANVVTAWTGDFEARTGMELVAVRVGAVTGRIPWEAIGRESCSLELEDVTVTTRPSAGSGEAEVFDALEREDGARAQGSAIMRQALNALCRGLKARLRGVNVVVQDAAGAGKFLVRLESAEYTHGQGVSFSGMSVRRIATGVECSVSEVVVRDVSGHAEIPSDFSRVDVELETIETTATVHAVKNFVDLVNAFGSNASSARLKRPSTSRPRRSFIDDVLSSGSAAMYASAYEEANDAMGESMGDSVYEDSNEELNEEFFDDAEVAIRELSESLGIDSSAEPSSATTVFTVQCPQFSMDAPFDDVVCKLTMTAIRIELSDRLDVSWSDARCIYGFDDDHELVLHLSSVGADDRCGVVLRDDCVSMQMGHAKLALNGVECVTAASLSENITATVYWLEDPAYRLDGSLPERCLAKVKNRREANETDTCLREQLANDASLFVKLNVPIIETRLSIDVVESVSTIIQSMYELPDNHPMALRVATPDSVMTPLAFGIDVGALRMQLDAPLTDGTCSTSTDDDSVLVECELRRARVFAATNIAGVLGSDFVWTQFDSARVTTDNVETVFVECRSSDQGASKSSLAFARMEGEPACADVNVVGMSASLTQCEPLIRRLNTFAPARDVDADTNVCDSSTLCFSLSLFELVLIYKSNDSFALIQNDFLRISSKGVECSHDAGVSTSFGVEMYCNEISAFMVPPEIKATDGIRTLPAFPFTNSTICAARFAPVMNAKAISLITSSSSSKTAIATVSTRSCVVSLQRDILRALKRLFMSEVEGADRPASPASGDENEYVFVSPVKKARDISHARYSSSVTEHEIAAATRDHDEMFPRRLEGQKRGSTETSEAHHRSLLVRRDTNARVGPNIIENFFYRNNRRVRRKRKTVLLAAGSVTAVRKHSSSRARAGGVNASIMSRSRFAGEFVEARLPAMPPSLPRVSDHAHTRYLPLPKDVVVPQSTVHVNGETFDVHILPGLFWSESPTSSPRHADSVEVDPLGVSAGIKLSLKTNTVRVDSFPQREGETAHRIACAVRDAVCTDVTAGATWPNVLKYDVLSGERGDRSDMCSLDIMAVRPDAKTPSEVEYLFKASSIPIHVKLDQRVLKLALDVFADDSDDSSHVASPPREESIYFQKIEIDRLSLRLDYCGRQVDIDSLRSGNLLEALNLVPWDGVLLDIQPLRLTGIAGVVPVVQTAVNAWLDDITRTQAHKFVQSVKPIKSATNIGRRAAGLVSKPLEFHRNNRRGGVVAGFALGVASFVKEVSLSSIELGAFAAGQSAALLAAAEGMIVDAEREIEDVSSPTNVFHGLSLASKTAWRGARRATDALVVEPIRDYATGDVTSSAALLGAVRKVPYAAVTGAKGFTKAVDHALSGAVASFRPPSRDADASCDADDFP